MFKVSDQPSIVRRGQGVLDRCKDYPLTGKERRRS